MKCRKQVAFPLVGLLGLLGLLGMTGAALLIASVGVAATQSGVKQTEKLAKRAQDTVKAIEETKQQLERTLNLYNTIVQNKAEDTKKAYKDLGNWIKDSEKKRANVGNKAEDMEKEAHVLFAEWTQSVDGITNPDLRKRSQERLNDTRVRYGEILRVGRQAGGEFDAFIQSLQDQVVYLGYDLNPAAFKSLAGDAKNVNAQAATMFTKLSETTKLANEYIASLKP